MLTAMAASIQLHSASFVVVILALSTAARATGDPESHQDSDGLVEKNALPLGQSDVMDYSRVDLMNVFSGKGIVDEQEYAERKYGRYIMKERHFDTTGVDPGTVIAVAALSIEVLHNLLKTLSGIERAVALGVDNETGKKWTSAGTFFRSGTSDTAVPYQVSSGEVLIWDARKTSGPVATGAVGVFAYSLDGNTLAIMYSVPFDYNFYSNWWNVKIYSGRRYIGQSMYEDLYYYADPFLGTNNWYYRNLGYGYKVRGNMGSSGKATLEIHIEKA